MGKKNNFLIKKRKTEKKEHQHLIKKGKEAQI